MAALFISTVAAARILFVDLYLKQVYTYYKIVYILKTNRDIRRDANACLVQYYKQPLVAPCNQLPRVPFVPLVAIYIGQGACGQLAPCLIGNYALIFCY